MGHPGGGCVCRLGTTSLGRLALGLLSGTSKGQAILTLNKAPQTPE